ncbi:MAG TPA: hypothetical protein VFS19_00655 [Planctomycetota bacterium]|nr:hypothetical protein [Planctomycetota bacterium]
MATCRIVMAGLAAILLAGFQDQAEIDRWIADLVNVDEVINVKAQKSLLKAGAKALPALKIAAESKNSELADRARKLVAEIERLEFEKQHDATQRPRRLEIVTLQLKDAPLSDALKALGAQVDSTFHSLVDQKQKLTIEVKDTPLRKCLDQMEDLLKTSIVSRNNYHRVSKEPPSRKKRAYVPGATFEFTLVKVQKEGQPAGLSLLTDITGTAATFIEAIEVTDSQKAKVEVEWCGRCSPRYVHLKTDKPGPFTVRLKGRLVWESPYDLAVADPAKLQDYKVGPFSIRYEYPKVSWTTTEPVAEPMIGRAELVAKLKKQNQPPGPGGAMGMGVVPPLPRVADSWCTCVNGPTPFVQRKPVKLGGGSYFEAAFRTRKPDQFESMKVRFYKGIEETFEAEASLTAE